LIHYPLQTTPFSAHRLGFGYRPNPQWTFLYTLKNLHEFILGRKRTEEDQQRSESTMSYIYTYV
jgi:hypothetical protein